MNAPEGMPDVETLRSALRTVIDPEAGMNIVDLGLVYGIEIQERKVIVDLTMTSPACPMGEMITEEAEDALRDALPESATVEVRLVWSPPWEPSMMSDAAREHFGW